MKGAKGLAKFFLGASTVFPSSLGLVLDLTLSLMPPPPPPPPPISERDTAPSKGEPWHSRISCYQKEREEKGVQENLKGVVNFHLFSSTCHMNSDTWPIYKPFWMLPQVNDHQAFALRGQVHLRKGKIKRMGIYLADCYSLAPFWSEEFAPWWLFAIKLSVP